MNFAKNFEEILGEMKTFWSIGVKSERNSNFGKTKENYELIIFERNELWKNINAEL